MIYTIKIFFFAVINTDNSTFIKWLFIYNITFITIRDV